MNSVTRASSLCGLMFLIALTSGTLALAEQLFQNFDSSPASWTGVGNVAGVGFDRNQFGFTNSSNAGGTAGEAGGAMRARDTNVSYYADTWMAPLTQQSTLSADFLMSITEMEIGTGSLTQFDGGVEIGWFNPAGLANVAGGAGVGGVTDAIVLRLVDNNTAADTYRAQVRIASSASNGNEVVLNRNVDYKVSLDYDPNGGGANVGRLSVEFRLASDNSLVDSNIVDRASNTTPYPLQGFGLLTLDFNSNFRSVDAFFDNLDYTVPEPSGAMLMALGIASLWHRRRSRR